jgi:hypothetical protein
MADRMAFDLHNPACRRNFKMYFKWEKFKWHWWKLVINDTWNNVCPTRKETNQC